MHIFPFAEAAVEATTAAGNSKASTTFYALSIIPQEGFHGKLATKDPRSGGPAPLCGMPSITSDMFWPTVSAGEAGTALRLGKVSKFLLTSSSDRSPPRFP